jgi:hypothetical protein
MEPTAVAQGEGEYVMWSGGLAQSTAQCVLVLRPIGQWQVVQRDLTTAKSNQCVGKPQLNALVSIRNLLEHGHRRLRHVGQALTLVLRQSVEVVFELHAATLPRGNVTWQVQDQKVNSHLVG